MEDKTEDPTPQKMSELNSLSYRPKIILKHHKEEKGQLSNLANIKVILIEIILYTIYITINCMIVYKLYSRKEDGKHSWQYGVIMVLIHWVPALTLIPNELYYKTELVPSTNYFMLALETSICVLLFPLLPIFLYGKHITSSQSKYLARLDTITSLNQIIFTSLHMILLIFLTMRGHLYQGEEVTCILNGFDRSGCIMFPVLVNAIISAVLYIKSSFYILLKEPNHESTVKLMPWLISTLLFRTTSFAYIVVYVDYWAIIPISGILLVMTIQQGWVAQYEENNNLFSSDNTEHSKEFKGHYALIWSGRKWIHKGLDHSEKQFRDTDSHSKLSYILKGSLRIVAPIFSGITGSKAIKNTLIDNVLIILIISQIFSLINYVDYFQYEESILSNTELIKITIFLLCYGIFSPFLVLLNSNGFSKIFQYVCSFVFLIVIVVIPILLCNSKPLKLSGDNLKIFIIKNNSSGYFLDVLANLESSKYNLGHKYKTSNIYWDTTCKDDAIHNKTLLLINLLNKDCMSLLNKRNNISVPIMSIYDANIHRSSSKKVSRPNLHYLSSYIHLVMAGNVDHIYIGNLTYMLSVVKENTFCSSTTNVELTRKRKKNCQQYKYLTYETDIYEMQCVEIMGSKYTIDVSCNTKFNSSFNILRNETKIKPRPLLSDNGLTYNSCCLNKTYSVQIFGDCYRPQLIFLQYKSISFNEKSSCEKDFNQWNIGYLYLGHCLYRLEYRSPCDQKEVKYPICAGFKCINV